jgi:hypothetical protein
MAAHARELLRGAVLLDEAETQTDSVTTTNVDVQTTTATSTTANADTQTNPETTTMWTDAGTQATPSIDKAVIQANDSQEWRSMTLQMDTYSDEGERLSKNTENSTSPPNANAAV